MTYIARISYTCVLCTGQRLVTVSDSELLLICRTEQVRPFNFLVGLHYYTYYTPLSRKLLQYHTNLRQSHSKSSMHLRIGWLISISYSSRLVLLQFYCTCSAPTIKEPTIKQKFFLFYFYFSFIAVVRAA